MSFLASSTPTDRTDVLVVGAGVVGAAISQDLAARGFRVVVVDRAPGIGGGCSYANAAILAPSHVGPLATPALLREAPLQMVRRPPAVRVGASPSLAPWLAALVRSAGSAPVQESAPQLRQLAELSVGLHRELADRGLNPTFAKRGAIDVYARPPRSSPPGLLSGADLEALEPALGPAAVGSHDSQEWVAESRSFVGALLGDAVAHGADLRYETGVRELVTDRGRIVAVRTDRGRIAVEHVVLAAGVESGTLSAQVGVRLPLRGGRGYGVDLEPSAATPSMPVRVKRHRVVVTPLPDRVRVCGSIEFGDERRPADLRRADALLRVAAGVLPGLAGRPVIDRWAGDRPCSADGLPAIGISSVCPNLSVAAGHGMWGLVLAPVTARLVVDEIVGQSAGPIPAFLHPDRFSRRGDQRALVRG